MNNIGLCSSFFAIILSIWKLCKLSYQFARTSKSTCLLFFWSDFSKFVKNCTFITFKHTSINFSITGSFCLYFSSCSFVIFLFSFLLPCRKLLSVSCLWNCSACRFLRFYSFCHLQNFCFLSLLFNIIKLILQPAEWNHYEALIKENKSRLCLTTNSDEIHCFANKQGICFL